MKEYSHQYFNMVTEEEQWHHGSNNKASEDKKLELRLGPPGEFLSYNNINGANKRDRFEENTVFQSKKFSSSWPLLHFSTLQGEIKNRNQKEIQEQEHEQEQQQQAKANSYIECCRVVDKKPCYGPATTAATTTTSHKRDAPAEVVGWPPIRSFRKNLASSSNSKMAAAIHDDNLQNKTPTESCTTINPEKFRTDLFVKINMEGVPIGRKINLNAYDSYEKLSVAIDELFRGLLAAQRETCANNIDVGKANTAAGSSGTESGEYTLVYEDSEGDRILVGDVPWHMFLCTAKRLRVLKSSKLSTPRLGSCEEDKTSLISVVEIGR